MAVKYVQEITGTIPTYNDSAVKKASPNANFTMQLFGLPYQFTSVVDQRDPEVSKKIGRKFLENIIMDSPIVSIIPGKPAYLPGVKDKTGHTNAFINATSGDISELSALIDSNPDQVRLYDFQSDYLNTYQYINMLCREAAVFMELDAPKEFTINGKPVNFKSFDWRNYRWDGFNYTAMSQDAAVEIANGVSNTAKKAAKKAVGGVKGALSAVMAFGSKTVQTVQNYGVAKAAAEAGIAALKTVGSAALGAGKWVVNGVTKVIHTALHFGDFVSGMEQGALDIMENTFQNKSYMQFYCDASAATGSESLSNETSPPSFKQTLDSAGQTVKELAFLTSAGGMDTEHLQQLGDAALSKLGDITGTVGLSEGNSGVGSLVSRLLSSGKSIIRGENIMMPNIWTGSSNSKSYSLTFKFKAVYGNRLSVYMDVIVPTLHCVALAYPRATTANSFTSPPLLKVYQKGCWTSNLAICSGIEISKQDVKEAFSVDDICTEVTVTMQIQDLYTDIALTPANDPVMFINNTSLVEFLGTTCGMDLVQPQLRAKSDAFKNVLWHKFADIPKTMTGKVWEKLDNMYMKFAGL